MNALLVDLACASAWVLVLVPTTWHLFTGWARRRDYLFGLLGESELEFYFKQFRRSDKIPPRGHLHQEFKRSFGVAYGRRHYVVPLLLLGFTAGVGLVATAASVQAWMGIPVPWLPFPPIAVGAFLGALGWVIGDQLMRFRAHDFSPADIYACTYRFLIAIPVGYALAATTKDDFGVPLAVLLGAFPTNTLWTISRRIASQRLGLGDSELPAASELFQLQGVGRSHAERFEEQGVTTIVELAWADPVDLSVRTNFDLWFVVDCTSQALLWGLPWQQGTVAVPVLPARCHGSDLFAAGPGVGREEGTGEDRS